MSKYIYWWFKEVHNFQILKASIKKWKKASFKMWKLHALITKMTFVMFPKCNGVDISFWPTRFNICLGIVHGLFYLHEIAQLRIIHRDIKASNILLDKRLQPKIADFGLALLFLDDKTHISTIACCGHKVLYWFNFKKNLELIFFWEQMVITKIYSCTSLMFFIWKFIYDWIYSINSLNSGINYAKYSDIIAFKIHWTIYALALDVLICVGDI